MSSRINLFPHPPNQSVPSVPIDTASCAAPVSMSVLFLSDSYFSSSPQSILFFYADRHCILRHFRGSVRPSSAQFVHLPCANPTPLTATPLSLSVLVGGGVGFVTWSPSRTSNSAAPLYLYVLVGGSCC